jgi:ribosome-binding factor A
LRVGEELRHALVRALARADFNDPDLADANITVTQVQVSPDLQNATAFVVPLGGTRMRETVAALNRAAGYLRGQLGREVTLRRTPRIGFAADDTFEQAAEIDRILDRPRVRQDVLSGAGRDEKDPDSGA